MDCGIPSDSGRARPERDLRDDQIYSRFDVIRGEVLVTAPEYKQAGHSIKLALT